jgi:hypothetical protein
MASLDDVKATLFETAVFRDIPVFPGPLRSNEVGNTA